MLFLLRISEMVRPVFRKKYVLRSVRTECSSNKSWYGTKKMETNVIFFNKIFIKYLVIYIAYVQWPFTPNGKWQFLIFFKRKALSSLYPHLNYMRCSFDFSNFFQHFNQFIGKSVVGTFLLVMNSFKDFVEKFLGGSSGLDELALSFYIALQSTIHLVKICFDFFRT